MKKTLLLLLSLLLLVLSENYGQQPRVATIQVNENQQTAAAMALTTPMKINSLPAQRNGLCNFITNNVFYAPQPPYDPNNPAIAGLPFNLGYVPGWIASHGSANIYDGVFYNDPPPFNGAGFCRMAANYIGDEGNFSEGIAQTIPAMQPGGKYAMSFFERMKRYAASHVAVDNFYIILMHTADAVNFNPNSFTVPTIPANSQTIYCEKTISNLTWKQVFFCFTANDNYDMIWVFPKTNMVSGSQTVSSSILFSYPEIIEVGNFTAGPAPAPLQPGCIVNIGPEPPNCSVKNAVFNWYAPYDPGFNVPIPPSFPRPSQQLSVDASIPANLGTWTLRMTVPGSVKPGNCGSTCLIQASVTVPRCVQAWPKVYEAKTPEYLYTDNAGNVFMFLHEANLANNINHAGALPPTQTTGEYTLHYTSQGVTNWGADGKKINFNLGQGDAQLALPVNTQFVNGLTGSISSPPTGIPINELILAEAANATYITRDNTNLYIHSPGNLVTGVSSAPPYYLKFNPATNHLFVVTVSSAAQLTLKQYLLQNNQLNLVLTRQLPNGTLSFVQIDNNNRLFVIQNGVLMQCNYAAANITYSNLNPPVTGLNNTSLSAVWSDNPYTDNRCLLVNQSDNYIYAVDFAGASAKRIFSPNLNSGAALWRYVFNGNDIYIAGIHDIATGLIIGNQAIPGVPPYFHSAFLSKFSLLNDFGLRQSQTPAVPKSKVLVQDGLSVNLLPNPVKDFIYVKIKEIPAKKEGPVLYRIAILDRENKVLKRSISYGNTIALQVTELPPGVYFLTVTDSNGSRVTQLFVKE